MQAEKTVQLMHQTVREFFTESAVVRQSRFYIPADEVHIRFVTICLRYLLFFVRWFPDESAHSNHDIDQYYERCATYINDRPLMSYILEFLRSHLEDDHRYDHLHDHLRSVILEIPQLIASVRGFIDSNTAVSSILGQWATNCFDVLSCPDFRSQDSQADESRRSRVESLASEDS